MPPLQFEHASPEELALCLISGDVGLLEKVFSVQNNFASTYCTMEIMNQRLKEFGDLKSSLAMPESEIVGDEGNLVFLGDDKHKLEAKIADINSIIGILLQAIEEDLPKSIECLKRYVTAVSSIDGLSVPKVKVL